LPATKKNSPEKRKKFSDLKRKKSSAPAPGERKKKKSRFICSEKGLPKGSRRQKKRVCVSRGGKKGGSCQTKGGFRGGPRKNQDAGGGGGGEVGFRWRREKNSNAGKNPKKGEKEGWLNILGRKKEGVNTQREACSQRGEVHLGRSSPSIKGGGEKFLLLWDGAWPNFNGGVSAGRVGEQRGGDARERGGSGPWVQEGRRKKRKKKH